MTRFAGGPGESPGFLLWHLTLRWQRTMIAALAPLGLTHVQFVLLACTYWLNEQGERPQQHALARHAGTDVKMTSQVLRRLEDRGLVVRRTDDVDTRAKTLTVTDGGRGVAVAAFAAVETADAEFFADCPPSLVSALLDTRVPVSAPAGSPPR